MDKAEIKSWIERCTALETQRDILEKALRGIGVSQYANMEIVAQALIALEDAGLQPTT